MRWIYPNKCPFLSKDNYEEFHIINLYGDSGIGMHLFLLSWIPLMVSKWAHTSTGLDLHVAQITYQDYLGPDFFSSEQPQDCQRAWPLYIQQWSANSSQLHKV